MLFPQNGRGQGDQDDRNDAVRWINDDRRYFLKRIQQETRRKIIWHAQQQTEEKAVSIDAPTVQRHAPQTEQSGTAKCDQQEQSI